MHADPDGGRARAFGRELVRTHDRLRDTLDDLRAAASGGIVTGVDPHGLDEHCLAFCAAVTAHHTGEDAVGFPALAAVRPDLADVLAELTHDHVAIAGILRRVRDLAADPAALPNAAGELDGLAAILDSHFAWEERRLVAALDTAVLPGSVAW